jgi:uncharacterized protein YukE
MKQIISTNYPKMEANSKEAYAKMADIKVIPDELTGSSPQFTSKATSVEDLATTLSNSTSTLIGDLGILAALNQMASAMENYQTRVATSMECFRTALQDAGEGLLETADSFVAADTELAGTFSALEPQIYSGYDSPTTTAPGLPLLNLPGTTTTPVSPVIGLQSGLTGGSTILGGSSVTNPGVFVNP